MNNQVVKEKLINIREYLYGLLNYYKELNKILRDNLLIDSDIYKPNIYNDMFNEIKNLIEEVNELINRIDFY